MRLAGATQNFPIISTTPIPAPPNQQTLDPPTAPTQDHAPALSPAKHPSTSPRRNKPLDHPPPSSATEASPSLGTAANRSARWANAWTSRSGCPPSHLARILATSTKIANRSFRRLV